MWVRYKSWLRKHPIVGQFLVDTPASDTKPVVMPLSHI
jgi:hypothetical protein